jgi:hypothetical protein
MARVLGGTLEEADLITFILADGLLIDRNISREDL